MTDQDFYRYQHQWSKIYARDITRADRERVLWLKEKPATKTTQRLRCYSPADLTLLCEDCGLTIVEIFSGGKMDYHTGTYTPEVPLNQAMSYIARLVHTQSLKS